jgi:hypothetical protein
VGWALIPIMLVVAAFFQVLLHPLSLPLSDE